MAKKDSSSRNLSAKWRALLDLLPGYDSVATAEKGQWFDAAEADSAVAFFAECLTHVEGELAGKPFILEPWQRAIVGALFGWKNADGNRRYREALIYVPRKNGKTPLAAGIANYVLFCDPERGQQNIVAAGDRDQAALLFRQANGMVQNEPHLAKRCKVFGARGGSVQKAITLNDDPSGFRVISADADTKHGGNLHLAIVDELHVQPNRDLVDTIQTSMASKNRRQPLLIEITTADFDRESICNEKHDYACKVRDGIIKDAAFLPVIYEVAIDADWKNEKVWAQANPNLGVSVSIDYLRRECKRAQETPTYENTFKRLHLNMKTEQAVRWIQLEAWDRGNESIDEADLAGRTCCAALDLSNKVDLSAFALVFPPIAEDQPYHVLARFWAPRERAEQRERRDRVPYLTWAKQGLITLTDGNVIDYEFIKASVLADAKKFEIAGIGYDPWNATQIALQLQEQGANMMEFGQGFRSMSEPSKELEKLLLQGRIVHGGNAVLRWMASNVAAETDPAGNVKPSKRKSTERIDGIVATIMALGLCMSNPSTGSVYEEHGIRRL